MDSRSAPEHGADPPALSLLSRLCPTLDAAVEEAARLSAELALPKGTIHILSDVHGEDAKLRHVINNVSGTLRPLVERLFAARLAPREIEELLAVLYYPAETLARLAPKLAAPEAATAYARRVLRLLFEVARTLARRTSPDRVRRALPSEHRGLLQDLFLEPGSDDGERYAEALVASLARHGRVFRVVELAVRLVHDLAVEEIVIAGDCWDRGPRGDRVMDVIAAQPNVAFTWGNHDVSWLGAALGHEALIANVLRLSARYRRFSQLEEGYGITLQPLENLVREAYDGDPAQCFVPRGTGLRPVETMARMQKAAAILQFKLEGQVIARRPELAMEGRRLLHRIDRERGTVTIDGVPLPLRDTRLPTIDPRHPYELSAEERACMDRIRASFVESRKLREHMRLLVERGTMHLRRDDCLVFHGCVPVDERGEPLELSVDGVLRKGRALFAALEQVVFRAAERRAEADLDMLWYLWGGARSPLFGKDRIATFEADLVDDAGARVEHKNPYFRLLHEREFCEKILREFGADPERGIIVNGHVPVKVEEGESPVKRSGKAVTIDGAFSAAYGDHGFTLILESGSTFLARHHHFESVEAAIERGADIIPTVTAIREHDPVRRVADTERGEAIRGEVRLLEDLAGAYRALRIRPAGGPRR